MTKNISLLDCTFRDGGYYNSWDFPLPLIHAYLKSVEASAIPAVELGFRMMPQGRFLGACAYTTDDFLRSLPLPKGVDVGVMVNAKDLLEHPEGPEAAVRSLFAPRSESPVSFVRVAAHFAEAARCRAMVGEFSKLGYRVVINIIQAGGKPSGALTAVAAEIQSWALVSTLYFADSLGNMDPESVRSTVDALRKGFAGELGIHTHDNMGQALANSLAAIDAGVKWVDGTMLGMGRGAGNVRTEYLLVEFARRGISEHYAEPVFGLVMDQFEPLRRKFGWGSGLLFYLSALYGIHPTYVQEMVGKGTADSHSILAALESLRKTGANAYSDDQLQQAMGGQEGSPDGTWSAEAWAKGKTLLVVASGPSLPDHLEAICRFIDRNGPTVLCLNASPLFPADRVTAYAACHRASLLMDAEKFSGLDKPLIAPLGSIPEVVRARLRGVHILDYGMGVKDRNFSVRANGCLIPAPLVAAYALALAEAAGAAKVLLAGFDGYPPADPRYQEMSHVLRSYQARPTAVPLIAITPTTYDVAKGSVYSPVLG